MRSYSNRVRLDIYLLPAEVANLAAIAKQLGLSRSELVRRFITGQRIPKNNERLDTIQVLGKINADLARLGNLQKLTLDNINTDNLAISIDKIHELRDNIFDALVMLKLKLKEIK